MLTSSVMLDMIIVVIVALLAWLGARHGLFRTLAELAAYVVAYLAAAIFSDRLAGLVAEWIRPLAEGQFRAAASDYLNGLSQELPAYLDVGELADAVEELEIGPLIEQGVYNLAYLLSAVAIFLAVMILLRLVIRAMNLITLLPVVHQFNALGGLLIGGAKGILLVVVILLLARQTGLLIDPAAIVGSRVVPLLQRFLPL